MSTAFVLKLITHIILFGAVVFASAYLDQIYRRRRDRRRRARMYRELDYQLALMDNPHKKKRDA